MRERESRTRFLAELDRLDSPCNQWADPVHVTASAIVASPRGTILHLHRRLGRWLQPGGHIEVGESPWDAATRETEEETGLEVEHPSSGPKLLHLDVHEAALGHTHLDLRYLVLSTGSDPRPQVGESPHAKWFSWDEAEAMADLPLIGALSVARRQWERVGTP